MQYIDFGNTGIKLSKIGLGTLTMGGLQKGSSNAEIAKVCERCVDRGINFCDTAQLYSSYNVAREMLKIKRDTVVISKSYAWDKKSAREAVEEALQAINRDYIDGFLMHEQESRHTMKGHAEAFLEYQKMKQEGKIRHVGISTHKVELVKDLWRFPEIEILHPLINHRGFGLFDGTKEEMEIAIENATNSGVGVYAMKIFGGGHLLSERKEALEYLSKKDFPAVIGMSLPCEVDYNCDMIEKSHSEVLPKIASKQITVHDWCELCGNCVSHCPQNALSIKNGKVQVDKNACVLCGYCGAYCESMCIKIF
ncbi:MAG: aldo/keto reductase [Bacillota bacterium]